MFILEISLCEKANFLQTVLFFKKLVWIISIIIPIALVLFVTVDIAKAVMANDDAQMKKAQNSAIKRIIIGLIVFFVPVAVNAIFSLFDGKEVVGLTCYNNATDEVVDTLVVAENEKLLLYEEDIKALIEAAKENQAAVDAKLEELREKAKNLSPSSNPSSNTAVAERIATYAEKWAWPEGTKYNKYLTSTGGAYSTEFSTVYKKFWNPSSSTAVNQRYGACCCHFVKTVVRQAIGDEKWKAGGSNRSFLYKPDDAFKKRLANMVFTLIKFDGKESSLRRGDIGSYGNKNGGGHNYIYLGNGLVAEANNSHPGQFAHISKWNSGNKPKMNNKSWYYIIRATS